MVRGVLARLVGLSELRLEVVGGDSTEVALAYLSQAEAARVRVTLLEAAGRARAGAAPEGGGPSTAGPDLATGPPPQVLARVPVGRLLGSVVLQVPVLLGVAAIGVLGMMTVLGFGPAGVGVPALPVLLGTGALVLRELQRGWGFVLDDGPAGLRRSSGLLEKRTQTVPLDRVQSVRLVQPALWRLAGWSRLDVDVAGYAVGADQGAGAVLLPVGPTAQAHDLLDRVMPGAEVRATTRTPAPLRARRRVPLRRRWLRAGASRTHVVCDAGLLTRTTTVAPWAKTQSLAWVQGPWQWRLRLATVQVHTAGRFTHVVAHHRDVEEARELVERGADLARAARSRPQPVGAASAAPADVAPPPSSSPSSSTTRSSDTRVSPNPPSVSWSTASSEPDDRSR